jgi:O-antigen/teichoic acid export membrane protein
VNVLGAVAPSLAGLLFIPAIVAGLGRDRFGVLSLAWVFINSVGILDLGIGRALTRFLAAREEPDPSREAATVWTSLAAILALGVSGGALVWALASPIASTLAHGDAAVRGETASTLRVLALSMPAVMLSSGLRGVLEAFGRFDLTNRVTIPTTLLNLALPAVLLRLGGSLLTIVSALVVLRGIATVLLLHHVLRVVPAMRRPRLRAAGMRGVLSFGGWVTISYLPGPLFAQAERYLLGSITGLSAVPFYSTPADLLTRVTVVPGAILQVLFPVLTQTLVVDRDRGARLANRAFLLIAAAVLPVLTLAVAVAPEALELWLGPTFAAQAARAGRVLALVTFMNCMDWLAFSIVQGAGLASWTGKLRAIEIPLYLVLVAAAIRAAGVDGVAVAALVRAAVDGAVLVFMATRVLGREGRAGRSFSALVACGVAAMAGAAAPLPIAARLAWAVAALAGAAAAGWRLIDREARGAVSTRAAEAWARLGSASP